jgi:hypothetical protein
MGKLKIVNYLGDVIYANKFDIYSVIYAIDGYDYIVIQHNNYKVWKRYPTYDAICQQELHIDINYIKELENESVYKKQDVKVPVKKRTTIKSLIEPPKKAQEQDLEIPKKKRQPRFKARTPDIQVLIEPPSKAQKEDIQSLIEPPKKAQEQDLEIPKKKRQPRFKARIKL